ncbi:MAG: 1-(5-phosphoribosyl)-5-[(5-phosphoribosylamino)methylideneamino]imidazole-4-carboxamide isomerase [Actinomycetota bacterium]
MIVIPAIDIIGGECVRLTRGKFDTKKKYYDDPVEAALKWKDSGASWLHVIDLDGAKQGKVANLAVAGKIKEETGLKLEMGGGIRDFPTLARVLDSGIDRAIIGTRAVEDFSFLKKAAGKYGKRVIVSLDFDREGRILKDGWQKDTGYDVYEFAVRIKQLGMERIIVTDVTRDGMLEGIDRKLIESILKKTGIALIVAGGVTKIEDIVLLRDLGVWGVIIGKALYESKIDLAQAIREAKKC